MTKREPENRPNPDQLLNVIQRNEERSKRGHLKIFLGMAAGVGKTFAMLQRAHQLKSDGVDVVVGWVDTHGRKDTANLVEGLEVFPRRQIEHKGVLLEEMDLEKILKRRPKVVLVDELAHTNGPQSRHSKRYQDVLDLLSEGIDVYTTVNVQHLESRVDTVKSITGIHVHETVPDSILDDADEIVLIDLPPDDLIQRLRDGRIYPADRAETAGRNFFTQGNLTALRELALRTAAGRVDRELREFKTLHGIDVAWKSSSRLLVAVFASPYSESLIRWTRQLAESSGGTWMGAYVESGQLLGEEEKRLLERNTQLVRSLGGDFAHIQDQDSVEGLLRLARQHHVTQIIVGKSQRSTLWNFLSGGSVVHRLLRKSGDIDIYAVTPEKKESNRRRYAPKGKPTSWVFPWGESGWVAGIVLVFWFLASFLKPLIGYQAVGIVFLMAVVVSGIFFSRISVFLVAVFLSLIHNFFFIPPLYTFAINEPNDVLIHVMLFLAAASIGHLTTRLRNQNKIIEGREDRAVQLFNLAHSVSEANNLDEVALAGVQTFERIFGARVAIVLFVDSKAEVLMGSNFDPSAKELAVAEWARQNGSVTGKFTDILPSAEATYFPLQSRRVVLGVIGLVLPVGCDFGLDRRNYALALAGQLASGLDRERLHESRQKLEMLEEADRLYRSLFDSVSHELKTPLTTVKGAALALLDSRTPESQSDLVGQINAETDRLQNVVDNMLNMTRLESGTLKPKIAVYDLADLLGPALKRLEGVNPSPKVELEIAKDLRPLLCDGPLLVQALANVLHNAALHAKANGTVKISAVNLEPALVEIRVADDGPGLPKENPNLVFAKFYRERPEKSGGVGIGLSIAKGFVEAQGGSLEAKNGLGGGAEFVLGIPSAKEEVKL